MAEAAATEDAKATASGGKGGKLAFLVVGLVAGGAGFAAPYFLPANMKPGAQAAGNMIDETAFVSRRSHVELIKP